MWLNLCIMNLLPTMNEDVTINQENFFAFSSYTLKKFK